MALLTDLDSTTHFRSVLKMDLFKKGEKIIIEQHAHGMGILPF